MSCYGDDDTSKSVQLTILFHRENQTNEPLFIIKAVHEYKNLI